MNRLTYLNLFFVNNFVMRTKEHENMNTYSLRNAFNQLCIVVQETAFFVLPLR